MKAFVLAVGLVVATVIQAVGLPWTAYSDTWEGDAMIKSVSYNGAVSSVACLVTIKQLPSSPLYLLKTCTIAGGGGNIASYYLSADGRLGKMYDAAQTWATDLEVGDTFVVAFNLTNNSNGRIFDYSYNGSAFSNAATYTAYNAEKSAAEVLSGASSETLAHYVDIAYYTMDRHATAAEVEALLPEPTALALLALGVAGVALKRKAA